MTRILVTGSRDWADSWALHTTLRDYLVGLAQWDCEYDMPKWPLTIIHGDCKTGLDFIASEWCINSLVRYEPHPVTRADWDAWGGAAGPMRNQRMVGLGADVCLAFPLGKSNGTRGTMRMASKAGIPVVEYAGEYNPEPRIEEWNATHSPYSNA